MEAGTPKPVALWVVPVSGIGGVARHVLDVAEAGLPGFELVVLSPDGPLVAELRKRGTRVAVGRFGPDVGALTSIRTLRMVARRLRPAVVHSHLAYADVIVAATPLPPGTRRVTTEHGIAGDDAVYHGTAAKSKIMATVHGLRLRKFDTVIAVSEATKRAMIEKWSPSQEIHVILNGVNPVPEMPASSERGASLRILALARLSPEKRIPQLLNAFKLVLEQRPDAHLTVAGVGELEGQLRALASELGIEGSVSFPGFVDAEAAMAEADVLAQLSVWENCSYSLLDAANRGMRVVASRVGGNPEIVAPRGLVDADSVESVAAALLDELAVTHLDSWPSVPSMTEDIVRLYGPESSSSSADSLPERVYLATNNGDIGGGEVMLLKIAATLDTLGVNVTVIGPSSPGALVAAARERDLAVVELNADGRKAWMLALRRWDKKHRQGHLWCNGLVPAFATSFRANRTVHLHQRPAGLQRALAAVARFRSARTVVPSRWMTTSVPGAEILPNWTEQVQAELPRPLAGEGPTVLGYLGRLSTEKGVDVLARAVRGLESAHPGRFRLVVAGEARFVDEASQSAVARALGAIEPLVEFTGWVTPEKLFSRIDLLVVPSVVPESFGLVVAEAMSARVPVIVSNAGALPEVLGAEDDVFPAGDPSALASAILAKVDGGVQAAVQQNFERWTDRFSPSAGLQGVAQMLSVGSSKP